MKAPARLVLATFIVAGALPGAGCSSSGGGVVPDPMPEIRIEKQGLLDKGADDAANPGDLIGFNRFGPKAANDPQPDDAGISLG